MQERLLLIGLLGLTASGCGGSVFVEGDASPSSSMTASGCTTDSDCGNAGPCNACPPAVELCLAPLAPVAALGAGGCKKPLAPCTPPAVATCGPVGTFPVGEVPTGIAFDGTNMWVASADDGTVTKLSPTGTTLDTFNVGMGPGAITFDGTNMWVVNIWDSNVVELSPTGATLATFPVLANTFEIAFDGTNIWVVAYPATVTELSPSGATLGTFDVGGNPSGIAFDGTSMWVASHSDNTVTKLSLTGTMLGVFAVGAGPAKSPSTAPTGGS